MTWTKSQYNSASILFGAESTLIFPRIICFENRGQIEREEDKCEQVQMMFQISDYKGSVTDQYVDNRVNIGTSISIQSFFENKHKGEYFVSFL